MGKRPHNIVLFGESGVGKSSLINMLCDANELAATSSSAEQCTLDAKGYSGGINGQPYTFWDTVGLQAGDQPKAPGLKEAASLYRLLCNLEDGLSLLVLVMRAPRITDPTQKNWKLFKDIICQNKVPVVVAVTHLEQENTDTWWSENAVHFIGYEMCPSTAVYREYPPRDVHADKGVACITASRGKQKRNGEYNLQEEYDVSRHKVRQLVYEAHLPHPWKVSRVEWYKTIVDKVEVRNWLGCLERIESRERKEPGEIKELVAKWKLSVPEAAAIIVTLEKALE